MNFQLNHELTPLEKSLIWRLCKMDILLSLESLSFYVEHQKTIFLGLFCPKTSKDQISIFQLKPWVNPFRKITTMVTLKNGRFYCLESLVFYLEHQQTIFVALF